MRGGIKIKGRRLFALLHAALLAALLLLAPAAYAFPFAEIIEPFFGSDMVTGLVWFFTGAEPQEETQETAQGQAGSAEAQQTGRGIGFAPDFCNCSEDDWFCVCKWYRL